MKDKSLKYAVLLRGVNIGGRKVKSAELKDCFAQAGYKKVKTVLATGNVIIQSEKTPEELRPQIEKTLLDKFNFSIKVGLVSEEKLHQIIEDCPFEKQENFHRYVLFLDRMIEVNDLPLDAEIETVKTGNNIIYWKVQKGFTLKSKFAKTSQKRLKNTFSTTRNLNTLEKIRKKMETI
ncbi:MAG TPA: DUF1697 domain-containing protein [Chitinophagaceae bacterium]|nr:DUF1697 domain-containing protein [Chitinophagaceae bacterium]